MDENKKFVVRPWHYEPDGPPLYAAFIGALGYEERARFAAQKIGVGAAAKFVAAFGDRNVLSFEANRAYFESAGFSIETCSDESFSDWCDTVLGTIAVRHHSRVRVCVDISSFTRQRLAVLFERVQRHRAAPLLDVDFVYSPATFSKPSGDASQIVSAEPVSGHFAGWSVEPDLPTAAVVGLGYEEDRALGALEYVEPGSVWAFKPVGIDPRYNVHVNEANTQLWERLSRSRLINYRVDDPYGCFTALESLVYGLVRAARPVLLPFGPKVFALIGMCVAALHAPKVGVWRVSSGAHETPIQRKPSGQVIGLTTSAASD
jgi:hypothetical protein